MSEVVRSGDDDKDMEAWMRRLAARLARDLVETELGSVGKQGEEQSSPCHDTSGARTGRP